MKLNPIDVFIIAIVLCSMCLFYGFGIESARGARYETEKRLLIQTYDRGWYDNLFNHVYNPEDK